MQDGWDNGQIYAAPVFQQEEQTNDQIETKFTEFLKNFRLDNSFVYREQLRQNLILKKYFVEVDLAHLGQFDEELRQQLRQQPKMLIPLFEEAVRKMAISTHIVEDQQFQRCQVMLISRSNPQPIRGLDSTFISKLVRVSGIVISVNGLQAKATQVQIMCRACRHIKVLDIGSGVSGLVLPRSCDSEPDPNGLRPKCPLDPYVIVHEKSKFVDQQYLKLQEPNETVPVGELPRHLLLSVDRYLTGQVNPGTRVTVTGVFDTMGTANKKNLGGAVAVRTPYIHVCGLQLDADANGDHVRTFTEQEEEEYIAMSRRPELYKEFTSSIAPQIYGSEDIKKSVACLLFGGSKNVLPDGMRLRGDVNVLLLGDPGTAKSQLLKFTERVAPIAVYTSGKGSSAAGLTASVIRDAQSRDFRLEAGAMVLADGGVVCIDEFDKMREEDRVAIHEAMEQQTISIAKAGITTILNSRTSVLAAANPVFGRYDDMKSAGENIEFQTTILSRFDLIFIVRDEHNAERDATIARHVVGIHMNTKQNHVEGDFDIQKMRGYISYCKKKCAPRLSPQAAEKLGSHFVEMRQKAKQFTAMGNAKTAIPITVRQLEAIVRIAESLAKMTLSPQATERHVDEAIRLFNCATMNAIQSGVIEGLSQGEFANEVKRVEDYLLKRFPMGHRLSERHLKDQLRRQDFSDAAIDRSVFRLVAKGVLTQTDRRTMLVRTA
ncbi:MCM2/3/5 family-domain-containing protein, partial [Gorgonomyces haynaldii]